MRIQHNIMAMNAYRNYTNNTSALSKNLEKLSSGYKINRAGDDAAGLAISEKMRAQITGLNKAQDNAKDGISLVQTAEGALTEVHDMLNRMVELATQSANGTYDNETDRKNLQDEMDQLMDEIDRIADSANFNGIKLLDGSLATADVKLTGVTLGGAPVTPVEVPATSAETTSTIGAGSGNAQKLTVEFTDAAGKLQSVTVEYTSNATAATNAGNMAAALQQNEDLAALFDISATGTTLTFAAKTAGENGVKVTTLTTDDTTAATGALNFQDGANATVTVNVGLTGGALTGNELGARETFTLNGTTYELVSDANAQLKTEGAVAIQVGATDAQTVENMNAALSGAGVKVTASDANLVFSATGSGLTLQIGDTSDDYNQLEVSVQDMHVRSLGLNGISIADQASAQDAVSVIKDAINTVSSVRGSLGAIQNRLDHTINNLSVMEENIQDAESSIRDTDVAEEMMAYTKNNILVQSAQAMLAQANQVPQGVLQLLQ